MKEHKFTLEYYPYSLKFKEPAGTSRGILTEKPTYIIKLYEEENPEIAGYGEVPFFPGLSVETKEEVEGRLFELQQGSLSETTLLEENISSVRMGIETALLDLKNGGKGLIFPSPFTDGETEIEINGLIWMGDYRKMRERVDEKLKENFKCIKIKIGAIESEEETGLIEYVREKGGKDLTIRLDANGAFSPDECLNILERLARYDIHSVEQPIRRGDPYEMRRICKDSPIPIALDEELIGIPTGKKRDELLDIIQPSYIILKPALCHGFSGASDWIKRAEKRGIGWWVTSALESSIGLNAIAQYTATLNPKIPQGLGTGSLYINNFPSKLHLRGDKLISNRDKYFSIKDIFQRNETK